MEHSRRPHDRWSLEAARFPEHKSLVAEDNFPGTFQRADEIHVRGDMRRTCDGQFEALTILCTTRS